MQMLPRILSLGLFTALVGLCFGTATHAAEAPTTERRYLSGQGPKDAIAWDFTVTAGRRAGEKATLLVPSNWEQHGFGAYNYGHAQSPKSSEHGLYSLRFAVPETWKERRLRLVFEGVMTDATVKVNGKSVGPTHQGAFYRFHYDITKIVKLGSNTENLLEVDVAKVSANLETEIAERSGDYWVFGGIFRPVWLEAAPVQSIEHCAINAQADGLFTADITLASARTATAVDGQILDAAGKPVGDIFSIAVPAGGAGRVQLATRVSSPRLWSAETPNLYSVRLTLRKDKEVLHTTTQRFGFRTVELRPGAGLFMNGQRILLKGVNRHSFRPQTARALNAEDCYEDVRIIRSMNMNAVRMSHYPPDEAFLEACDELGLYVLDELSGWHHAHDTVVGQKLVRAMVQRDVNHPSIVFWDNGNEGGFNRELDADFAMYDPQKRRVLHPWELHDDLDTTHYSNYDDLLKRLRGPHVFMPTEFIHALYDGGAGAGLEDYWNAMSKSPFSAGGFIWAFVDEGIARTDQNGRIDVFGTYAPDGIVGPHMEKEGSYYTVKDIWSPVQLATPVLDAKFKGKLTVTNGYDFTSLTQCRFAWKLLRYPSLADNKTTPTQLAEGIAPAPALAPHATGELTLALPANWSEADALAVTAYGPDQQELWTWTWATPALQQRLTPKPSAPKPLIPRIMTSGGAIVLEAGDLRASFDEKTGLLRKVQKGAKASAFTQGPVLSYARPVGAGSIEWLKFAQEDRSTQLRTLAAPHLANTLEIELAFNKTISLAGFKLEISPDGQTWKTLYDALRRSGDGSGFVFPPQLVQAVRLSNVRCYDGQPIEVKSVRLGYAASRFPSNSTTAPKILSGTGVDAQTGLATAWVEVQGGSGLDSVRWSLSSDLSLRLDYKYTLSGEFLYHGISFDHPEAQMKSLRWLGAGPYRVWQNRLRGTWLGVHQMERNDLQPGESFTYPEFQGCFAGLRWAQLETDAGPLKVTSSSPEIYLRVGTPRINHSFTSVEFPTGDLSFLHAIPAIGSKFVKPAQTGPASQPAKASGSYSGTLWFSF